MRLRTSNGRWLERTSRCSADGDEHYDIRLRVPEESVRDKQDVANLIVSAKEGRQYRLRDLARVSEGTGPVEIVREDQIKQVVVLADAQGASVGKALSELESEVEKLELAPGYEIEYGGKARLMEDLTNTTLGILGLAVFLAMVVLAVQFNSVRYPVMILCSIPAGAAGMVLALWATGLAMGATVPIGFLIVVAATVNDGVLLFTLADELREGSAVLDPAAAIERAATLRLRPRLMTTATTIAGLLPLAFDIGAGGDLLQPLAVGAIGGLILEIPVAMILMPSLYLMACKSRGALVSLAITPG